MGRNCEECNKRVIEIFEWTFEEDGYTIEVCGPCYDALSGHWWEISL